MLRGVNMKEKILIENGTIIDGTGSKEYAGNVVIKDNKIIAVGESAKKFSEDKDIKRIDASQKFVMPGIIDAHCHISFDEPTSNDELFFHRRQALAAIISGHNARKVLLAGVTGFCDPDSLHEIGIDLRDAINSGYVEGPRMSVGGNALLTSVGGTAGRLIPDEGMRGYAQIVQNKDEIITEVRRQIKNGADWIKIHVTGLIPNQREAGEISVWSYDELKLVCDLAHDLGIPVVGHVRNAKGVIDSIKAGMDMILHATFMDEEAIDLVCETKTPIVPTFTFQANLADFGEIIGASSDYREIFRKEITDNCEIFKKIHDAGVPLLCGTESGFSMTPYGEWHYRELEVFVKDIGMSNLESIVCATKNSSKAMKMEGEVGTLENGMLADILILNENPLNDITVLGDKSKISSIILNGNEVDRTKPEPEITPPQGWRLSPYSDKILTQKVAKNR
jgi:imidazolonepropionase-like amidohydrolase